MKSEPFFAAILTVYGLLGIWAVYYCLSPLMPAPTESELSGAIAWPLLSLSSLWAVYREERTS